MTLGKFLLFQFTWKEIAKTYEHVTRLIDDKNVRALLMYIAQDSFKHAKYLELMSESSPRDTHALSIARMLGVNCG